MVCDCYEKTTGWKIQMNKDVSIDTYGVKCLNEHGFYE